MQLIQTQVIRKRTPNKKAHIEGEAQTISIKMQINAFKPRLKPNTYNAYKNVQQNERDAVHATVKTQTNKAPTHCQKVMNLTEIN